MKVSYSKLNCWNSCPFLYKLKYMDKLEIKEDLRPDNPLFIGTAAHEAIEKRSVEAGIESYKSHYPELNRLNELEILKLETILPKAIQSIPEGEYEHKIDVEDEFIGYIDCLVPVGENEYDLLDFKCSNNINHYKRSGQVHIYKYYYEKTTGNKIRDMYYVFIPKSEIKLNENINTNDLISELSSKEIYFEKIPYDRQQVSYFFARKTLLEKSKSFNKRYSQYCNWCELKKFCKSNGADRSELADE